MKKLELDAINLTSECLRRFWQKDSSLVLSLLAEDVVWIGAQDAEFLLGFEQTREDLLAAEKEIPPCILLNAEFQAVSIGPRTCIVTGKYLTTTDETADFFLQGMQRCTFVWEKSSDGMRIHHIHVSNPLGELQLTGEERFPTTMGKLAHHYMEKKDQAPDRIPQNLCPRRKRHDSYSHTIRDPIYLRLFQGLNYHNIKQRNSC